MKTRFLMSIALALTLACVLMTLMERELASLSAADKELRVRMDTLSNELHRRMPVPDHFKYMSVRITTPFGGGSGVPISESLILTNRHVLEGMKIGGSISVDAMFGGAMSNFPAEILAMDDVRDLAIAKAPPLIRFAYFPKLADKDPLWGETVIVIGYPSGLGLVPTQGFYCHRESKDTLLVSCNGFFGNSGGPVLTSDGRLIGLLQTMHEPANVPYGPFVLTIAPTYLFHCVSYSQIKAHMESLP